MPYYEDDPQLVNADQHLFSKWEYFGLKAEFPNVIPASRIGRLLVALYEISDETAEELEAMPIDDVAGYQQTYDEDLLNRRKIGFVRDLVHNFQDTGKVKNFRNRDGLEVFDEFRELSNYDRLVIAVSKSLNEDEKQELLEVVAYAELYLFVDDWDNRPGDQPRQPVL